jgi:DNA-binding MarR family transcriptional regulator
MVMTKRSRGAIARTSPGISRFFNPHVEGIRYGVLDELVGYAIRQLVVFDHFQAALNDYHITPQRFSALVIIAENPGLTQTRLAEILGIARSGAMTIIRALEEMGYVEQETNDDDRRSVRIWISRKGSAALHKLIEKVREHDREISPAEQRTLKALLAKIGATQD